MVAAAGVTPGHRGRAAARATAWTQATAASAAAAAALALFAPLVNNLLGGLLGALAGWGTGAGAVGGRGAAAAAAVADTPTLAARGSDLLGLGLILVGGLLGGFALHQAAALPVEETPEEEDGAEGRVRCSCWAWIWVPASQPDTTQIRVVRA